MTKTQNESPELLASRQANRDLARKLRAAELTIAGAESGMLVPSQAAALWSDLEGSPADIVAAAKADPSNENLWRNPNAPLDGQALNGMSHDEYMRVRRESPERLGLGPTASTVTTNRGEYRVDSENRAE